MCWLWRDFKWVVDTRTQIWALTVMMAARTSEDVWPHGELNTSLFQVEIYSDQDYFHVFIDEHKILQYKHRQKQLSTITKLQILNDIAISSVEIIKRGL